MSHADEQQTQAAAAAATAPPCPACGASARRAAARYCATCGRALREREYSPADRLRASYRWPSITPPRAPRAQGRGTPLWQRRNEQTARGYVFLAYALIPVVGVVFCACAAACCAAGLRDARRSGRAGESVAARRGFVCAVVLAGVQVFIWIVGFYLPLRALSR